MKELCHRALSFLSGHETNASSCVCRAVTECWVIAPALQPGWRREAHFIVGTEIKPAQARGSRCGHRCVLEAGVHPQHVDSSAPCALCKDALAPAAGQLIRAPAVTALHLPLTGSPPVLDSMPFLLPHQTRGFLPLFFFFFPCCSSLAGWPPDGFMDRHLVRGKLCLLLGWHAGRLCERWILPSWVLGWC